MQIRIHKGAGVDHVRLDGHTFDRLPMDRFQKQALSSLVIDGLIKIGKLRAPVSTPIATDTRLPRHCRRPFAHSKKEH
jgi:hypothetical protein